MYCNYSHHELNCFQFVTTLEVPVEILCMYDGFF